MKKNQILTKTEKEEAQKYNNELFRLVGVKYQCKTIRDYYFIKTMYEMLSVYTGSDMEAYFDKLLDEYYNMTGIKHDVIKEKAKHNVIEDYYFNYGFTEAIYKYWLKYYYPTCLNFTSFLALYSGEELPFSVFENTTNTALKKMYRFLEEESVAMVRNELSEISKLSEEYESELGYKLVFRWKSKNDKKTCKTCWSLNGKVFEYQPNQVHANCRCTFEIERRYKK